jgi:formylglycine-generating enzyme required for sulfatase activity
VPQELAGTEPGAVAPLAPAAPETVAVAQEAVGAAAAAAHVAASKDEPASPLSEGEEADLAPMRDRPVAYVPIGNLPGPRRAEPRVVPNPADLPLPLGGICSENAHCASHRCQVDHCVPQGYVYIPAGSFWMGSDEADEARHFVTITRPFFLSELEVTQWEWLALMDRIHTDHPGCDGCPAEGNRWEKAAEYLNALSRREGLEPCYQIDGDEVRWPRGLDCLGYRFPTEAEWEYAARAGTSTDYPCGDRPGEEIGCLEATAWIRETSGGTLHPVGELSPNAFGLYDVIGNAWEWVWDRYDAYPPEPQVDPTGPSQGDYHIRRGCSYASTPSACYSATRNTYSRAGLRPARSVP